MASIEHLAKICRVCLQESLQMCSIFDQTKCNAKDIKFITEVEINENDGLPSHICSQCLKDAAVSIAFKKKTIASNLLLRRVVESSNKVITRKNNSILERSDISSGLINIFSDIGIKSNDINNVLSNCIVEYSNFINLIPELVTLLNIKAKVITTEEESVIESKYMKTELDTVVFIEDVNIIKLRSSVRKKAPQAENNVNAKTDKTETESDCDSDHDYNVASDVSDEDAEREPIIEFIKPVSDGSVPKISAKKMVKRTINGKRVYRAENTKKIYMCDICPFKAEVRFKLSLHMKQHLKIHDFKCDFEGCDKAFVSNGLLTVHKRKHTRENLPTCELCNKTFITKDMYLNHMSYVHSGIKRYNCPKCSMKFVSAAGWRDHLTIHAGIRPYLCHLCGKDFRIKKTLRAHMISHQTQRNYNCEICGKSFKRRGALSKHTKVVHEKNKKYSCDICNQTFLFPYLKQNHVETAHSEAGKRCGLCCRNFTTDDDLKAHELKHENPKDMQCRHCLKICKNKEDLECHTCRLGIFDMFFCRKCNTTISGAENFDSHNHQVHNIITSSVNQSKMIQNTQKELERVPCETCGKVLQKWRMEKHVNNYHNPDRFHCTICDKRMKTLSSFLRHQRMHTGYKPFKCDICSKEFLRNASLHYHMMEHTGERPEKCRYCDAAFKRVGDLHVHERRHQNRMIESKRRGRAKMSKMPLTAEQQPCEDVVNTTKNNPVYEDDYHVLPQSADVYEEFI